jgi:hypothetical protein
MSHDFHWSSLVPLVAIVGGMGMGVIGMLTEHRRKQALMEERRLMIEKGLVPPPLNERALQSGEIAGTAATVESSLRTGIITLFVGLGLLAFSFVVRYFLTEEFTIIPRPILTLTGPAGALVSVIGIGNLVYFWIASRRTSGRA